MLNKLSMLLLSLFLGLVLNAGAQETGSDTEVVASCILESKADPKYKYCKALAKNTNKYCWNQVDATQKFCRKITKTREEADQCFTEHINGEDCRHQYYSSSASCEEPIQEKIIACVVNNTDKNQSDALKLSEIVKRCMYQDKTVKINFEFCKDIAQTKEEYCEDKADVTENFCSEQAKTEEDEDQCEDKLEQAEDRCSDQYDVELDYCEKENFLKDVTVCVEMATTADTQNSQ